MTRATRRQQTGAWWLALTVVCAAAQMPVPAQTGRTQERDLFVSVLDAAGNPVTNLSAADFVVRENRVGREVLRVRRATDPLDLAILIDNSQASSEEIMDLRRGLEPFVKRISEVGHVAVTTVADRPTLIQDYTKDLPSLQKAVGRLFAAPGSGATMLDAVSEVSKGFAKRDAERISMLAIWLGGREFGNDSHEQVLEHLRKSGGSLNVMTVGAGIPPDVATTEGRHRESLFDLGTRETGGRRQNVLSSMALGDALAKLADDLSNQYRLTYARPDALIPAENLEVAVKTTGLTARGTPVRVVKKRPERP